VEYFTNIMIMEYFTNTMTCRNKKLTEVGRNLYTNSLRLSYF